MKIVKILLVKKNSLNHNVVVPSQLLSLLQKHSFPNPAHRVNNNIKDARTFWDKVFLRYGVFTTIALYR